MIISALGLKQGKGQPIRAIGAPHLLTKKGTPTAMICRPLRLRRCCGKSGDPLCLDRALRHRGFAAIGFYDDYLKVTKQSHLGFSRRSRLARIPHRADPLLRDDGATSARAAVLQERRFWLQLLFGPFVIVAFGNAVNLTEQLDGLAIVPVMVARAFLELIAFISPAISCIRDIC